MVDYLTNTFGFSHEKAIQASKPLSRLKSTKNPDSVLGFLKLQGFDEGHLSNIVSRTPRSLLSNVGKTLQPKFRAFRDLGFPGPELAELLISNPGFISWRCDSSTIQFWRTLFGNDDKALRKALKRNFGLLSLDIAKNVIPKIKFLRDYCLSYRDIRVMVLLVPSFFNRKLDFLEALLKRTQELGFPSNSPMFACGVVALSSLNGEAFRARVDLFKIYRWSEDDFLSAFRKAPQIASLSERSLRTKMEFLVERAGCMQSYIALHPELLRFSLEERLMPRHHILQILRTRAVGKVWDITTAMEYSKYKFVKKFILPCKKEMPDLQETYIAACADRVKET